MSWSRGVGCPWACLMSPSPTGPHQPRPPHAATAAVSCVLLRVPCRVRLLLTLALRPHPHTARLGGQPLVG